MKIHFVQFLRFRVTQTADQFPIHKLTVQHKLRSGFIYIYDQSFCSENSAMSALEIDVDEVYAYMMFHDIKLLVAAAAAAT